MTNSRESVPPSPLSQVRQRAIVEALRARGKEVTPRRFCRSDERIIFEMDENLAVRAPGNAETQHLHYVLSVCKHCGHKSELSIDALGLQTHTPYDLNLTNHS